MPDVELLKLKAQNRQKEKSTKFLIWAGFFVYILMMGSKNVYTAEVAAIQLAFNKTKAEASLAMTYYFITYAIGQLAIAPLFSKLNLKVFLTVTMGLSSAVTVALGLAPSMELLYLLCGINGVLQAGVYSGVMAIISKYAPVHLLPYANKIMSAGGAIYGVISYGVPAIFVKYGLWDVPFILLGIIFAVTVAIFFIAVQNMKKYPPEISEIPGKKLSSSNEPMYIDVSSTKKKVIFFTIMSILSLTGYLMYSLLMQWVPSLLHEEFNMDLSYSILITLLVPIAIFGGSFVTISLCEKYKNVFKVGLCLATIGLVVFSPMLFFYDVNIIFTLVCVVGFIAISSASRLVYLGILAFRMRAHINTGAYLAFLNAIMAVMAGVAPPVAGQIIDSAGYGKLFLLLFIIGVVFIGLLIVASLMVTKTAKKNLLP